MNANTNFSVSSPQPFTKILWVDRQYRISELSHIPGGDDIVIEYTDGSAYGYDWIKHDYHYIREIFRELVKQYWTDEKFALIENVEHLICEAETTPRAESIIRNFINGIYIYKLNSGFMPIWVSKDHSHPISVLFNYYQNKLREKYGV